MSEDSTVKELLFEQLREMRADVKNISERVTALETNNTYNKENIENIGKLMKEISLEISNIKEIDIVQTADLKEHIRRTNLLEEEVNILKKVFQNHLIEGAEGGAEISIKKLSNEKTDKILNFLKWFIPILLGALATFFGLDLDQTLFTK